MDFPVFSTLILAWSITPPFYFYSNGMTKQEAIVHTFFIGIASFLTRDTIQSRLYFLFTMQNPMSLTLWGDFFCVEKKVLF